MHSGEQVKAPEGTRQKSGRNFGIRPSSAQAEDAVNVSQATVYQKHRSLLNS